MKKLIIVRHAKSDWRQGSLDKDRPLMNKGVMRANLHADLLIDKLDYTPEYWASSHAVRALHTAIIFAEKFNHINNLKVQKELYTFEAQELHKYIATIPNVIDSAIIFGHNDACLDFINHVTDAHLLEFKTSACATMTFSAHRWEDIAGGKLEKYISKNKIQ